MLDVSREQKADLAFAVHALDGPGDSIVALDDPWLSREVVKPVQVELSVLSHTEALVDQFVVVAEAICSHKPCAQRSEVFFQHERAVVLLQDPSHMDISEI